MILSGLSITCSGRLTQPNDTLDVEVDVFKVGSVSLEANFYNLYFFDLVNGTLTGADDSGSGITTGYKAEFIDTNGNVVVSIEDIKPDKYESETSYIIKSMGANGMTPASDIYISDFKLYYVGNDGSAESTVLLATSSAFANSVFAVDDGNGNKGIQVAAANGALTASFDFRFVISK